MRFLNPISAESAAPAAADSGHAVRVYGSVCDVCEGQQLVLVEEFTSRLECLSCGTLRLRGWTSHLIRSASPLSPSKPAA